VVTSVARAWLSWYAAVSGQELGYLDTWSRSGWSTRLASPRPARTQRPCWLPPKWIPGSWTGTTSTCSPAARSRRLPRRSAWARSRRTSPAGRPASSMSGCRPPVTFRGMPNQRWWDFEDSSIDFGAISAPVESLTTSVMVEFALRYGNDHFIIPLPLAIGSVLRTDSLVVIDTFGEVLLVLPIAEVDTAAGPFRLFEHLSPPTASGAPTRDPLFVLFPTVGDLIRGQAIEEVHFVRDEAAEIVWAIEQTALGPDGLPVDRTAAALANFMPLTPTLTMARRYPRAPTSCVPTWRQTGSVPALGHHGRTACHGRRAAARSRATDASAAMGPDSRPVRADYRRRPGTAARHPHAAGRGHERRRPGGPELALRPLDRRQAAVLGRPGGRLSSGSRRTTSAGTRPPDPRQARIALAAMCWP
jgi:hypothetical protein